MSELRAHVAANFTKTAGGAARLMRVAKNNPHLITEARAARPFLRATEKGEKAGLKSMKSAIKASPHSQLKRPSEANVRMLLARTKRKIGQGERNLTRIMSKRG